MPRPHPCVHGGWRMEVTWGHLCDSGIALSPSQPQPCPWAVAALSHVMAHAVTHPWSHLGTCPPWSHPVPVRLGCDFCPLPGWAYPWSCLASQTRPQLPQPKALAVVTGYFWVYFVQHQQKIIFSEASHSTW